LDYTDNKYQQVVNAVAKAMIEQVVQAERLAQDKIEAGKLRNAETIDAASRQAQQLKTDAQEQALAQRSAALKEAQEAAAEIAERSAKTARELAQDVKTRAAGRMEAAVDAAIALLRE
jgi:vacuolar-type H+-ATPase subunit H